MREQKAEYSVSLKVNVVLLLGVWEEKKIEHKNDVTIFVKLLFRATSHSSSVKYIIFMFKM